MISTNKKIGIVYCENSKKYVDEFVEIIMEKKSEGYCVETIVVDDKLIDSERMLERRVFTNLNKCDYGIVFLTKDLEIEEGKFVSRPNVLLELGYLRGRLKRDCTWCIIDFPYKDIVSQVYLMPSDFIGEVPEVIDRNNYKGSIRNIVNNFIKAHTISKLKNYNANDLVGSLILNSCYKTDYKEIFSKNQLEMIEKYAVKHQLKEIIILWIGEKDKLSDAGQIIYLFERIVFLPFFPGEIIYGKLDDFLSVKNNEESEVLFACIKILRCISEYENYKRETKQYESAEFYMNMAKQMQREWDKFENYKISPIIECITKNYIGLSYLNSYFASHNNTKEECSINQKDIQYLELARNNFERVIELSEKQLSDNMNFFQAFSEYNLARVKRRLKIDANSEYHKAVMQRRALSKVSSLPEIFRLIFSLEKIYAEMDYHDYLKEVNLIDMKTYMEKIESASDELRNIKQAPTADVSLFETLEKKLQLKVEELKKQLIV